MDLIPRFRVKLAAVIGSPSRRVVAAAAAAVVVLVVAFVALAAFHDDDTSGVYCAAFRVTPDLWAKADYDGRLQLQDGMTRCGQILGQPDTQVIAMLGPPDGNAAGEIDYDLPFGQGRTDHQIWRIRLDDEAKVKSSQVESPPTGP
jgi:hypothetical protein